MPVAFDAGPSQFSNAFVLLRPVKWSNFPAGLWPGKRYSIKIIKMKCGKQAYSTHVRARLGGLVMAMLNSVAATVVAD